MVVVVAAVEAAAAHNQGVGPQSGEWATCLHARVGEGQRATVKNAHLDSDRHLFLPAHALLRNVLVLERKRFWITALLG